jgi:hypothetical protein
MHVDGNEKEIKIKLTYYLLIFFNLKINRNLQIDRIFFFEDFFR